MLVDQRSSPLLAGAGSFIFNSVGQAITGLQVKAGPAVQAAQQGLELGALQSTARGQHADVAGAAERGGGLERRLDADDGQRREFGTQQLHRGGGGGVAGDHQCLDGVIVCHPRQHGTRPLGHEGIAALAVGGVRVVGKVDEALVRQFGQQRAQHAQAADAAVEHADGGIGVRRGRRLQAAVTATPLNSPLAMRFSHSAGPVMWALVPPASTATVTGMSTTSNS